VEGGERRLRERLRSDVKVHTQARLGYDVECHSAEPRVYCGRTWTLRMVVIVLKRIALNATTTGRLPLATHTHSTHYQHALRVVSSAQILGGSFIKLGFHQRRRLKADASDRALYSEDDRKGRLAGEASAAAHAIRTGTTPSGRQGIVRLSDERTGTVSLSADCRRGSSQIEEVTCYSDRRNRYLV
jgi:hypothetical protein